VQLRTDLTTKVFKTASEYDVLSNQAARRQPDTDRFVYWEVAGASHSDRHAYLVNNPIRLRDAEGTAASDSAVGRTPRPVSDDYRRDGVCFDGSEHVAGDLRYRPLEQPIRAGFTRAVVVIEGTGVPRSRCPKRASPIEHLWLSIQQ
jgi:hypothetical protein